MYREHHQPYCHPFFRHRRRFLTEEEKKELQERYHKRQIKWIERYKESLEKELIGVNERLNELKKETE
jgi:ATP-dependent RNA circularization protein (DNA/RNA ligase family)